ncbi:hypothetical protein PhCBS80983_g01664 [Powellomyces hirtus]|uniref:Ribosomal protein/NADH dehydrogenase domain-containing protein n=1 Tax=Powellomyces hirtus TaxID=109895 RepID=A0A507E9P8_9FUNG|nr:hypothetical protein PhCBS80983_g01664 [Powellomyces hirtus]
MSSVIKAFSVKSLSRNLSVGNGVAQFPMLKKVGIIFGNDQCIAKPSLSSFYVNELPRLHNSNPHIEFTTAPEEGEHCSISLTLEDNKNVEIDLRECPSSAAMYKRIAAASSVPEPATA